MPCSFSNLFTVESSSPFLILFGTAFKSKLLLRCVFSTFHFSIRLCLRLSQWDLRDALWLRSYEAFSPFVIMALQVLVQILALCLVILSWWMTRGEYYKIHDFHGFTFIGRRHWLLLRRVLRQSITKLLVAWLFAWRMFSAFNWVLMDFRLDMVLFILALWILR